MKTAFELFSEEYGTDHLTGDIYDYTPILEQFGEILIRVDDEDYSGDSYLIYKKDGKYGYLIFGWGSCSGCDALQGCDTYDNIISCIEWLIKEGFLNKEYCNETERK